MTLRHVPDHLAGELVELSQAVHADPELAYEERRAADRLCALVERHGHAVERPLGGLATAFRARFGPPGPGVALLAEYDALPGVGHACGHNLIAMTNVGAFLAAAASDPDGLRVGIEVVGTPAEEHGGGKADLLEAGVFEDAVAALSTHPASQADWVVGGTGLAIAWKRAIFEGAPAHAGSAPEHGRNALNGVIRLFTGIDGWRQHLPTDARVHGIVVDGGAAANVVPARAEALFGLRARSLATLEGMLDTFDDIAEGAALQTQTAVRVSGEGHVYAPVQPDERVGDLLASELAGRGVAADRGTLLTASTDLGNVSLAVPTDWIRFPVTTEPIAGHSDAMREASVSELAHRNALLTTDALAAAALRLARAGGPGNLEAR